MPSFHNDEDRKIWAVIEAYQFEKAKNPSVLRQELYEAILQRIGYCKDCKFFSRENNTCTFLKIQTGDTDRCGDFDRVEKEDESAFEIMTESFTEHQKMMTEATKINKYTHWGKNSKAPRKADDTPEEEEEPFNG